MDREHLYIAYGHVYMIGPVGNDSRQCQSSGQDSGHHCTFLLGLQKTQATSKPAWQRMSLWQAKAPQLQALNCSPDININTSFDNPCSPWICLIGPPERQWCPTRSLDV